MTPPDQILEPFSDNELKNLRREKEVSNKIIIDLKRQLKCEKTKISRLKHKFKKKKTPKEMAYDLVKPLLTKNQVDILLNKKKWVRWTSSQRCMC